MKSHLYECQICKHINHVRRLHCTACGTIPAKYSSIGQPQKLQASIAVYVAFGAQRIGFSHATKVKLQTVPADYYAEV